MHSLILPAAVCLCTLIGGFLLYLAENRILESAASAEEEKDTALVSLWGGRMRKILLACELLCNGGMAAFLELFYHDTILNTINVLLLCSVLWACAWTDLRARLIPNQVLLYGFFLRCGMLGAELFLVPHETPLDLIRSGVAAIALCIVAVLCRLVVPGAVGFGDVKLLMLMGFFLGTDRVWSCIFFTMLISFFYSVALLMTKRATMKTEIPYAPFLLLGTVTATFLVNI